MELRAQTLPYSLLGAVMQRKTLKPGQGQRGLGLLYVVKVASS